MFGILFLAILAMISNIGEESIANIEEQMWLMNCPLPTYSARPVFDPIEPIQGFAVVYTLNYTGFENDVFVFDCQYDELSNPPFTISLISYESTEGFFSLFDNAFAWVGFVHAYITALFLKLSAMFTLVSFFVSPTNFNILGYTIDDIGGIGLMFVVGIYAMCYVAIGAWVYNVLKPTGGGS